MKRSIIRGEDCYLFSIATSGLDTAPTPAINVRVSLAVDKVIVLEINIKMALHAKIKHVTSRAEESFVEPRNTMYKSRPPISCTGGPLHPCILKREEAVTP